MKLHTTNTPPRFEFDFRRASQCVVHFFCPKHRLSCHLFLYVLQIVQFRVGNHEFFFLKIFETSPEGPELED